MRLPRLHSEVSRHGVAALIVSVGVLGADRILRANGIEIFQGNRTAALVFAFTAFGLYGPVFLLLTHCTFLKLKGDSLKSRLRRTDRMSPITRMLFIGGPRSWAAGIAVMGMATVGTLLLDPAIRENTLLLVGCIVSIVGTWVLLVAVYAIEYARLWANGRSLRFPDGDEQRSLADFVYLAVQVSTTFSTSDVSVMSTKARGTVTAHSIVAFAYNTVIIAVLVSFLMSFAS